MDDLERKKTGKKIARSKKKEDINKSSVIKNASDLLELKQINANEFLAIVSQPAIENINEDFMLNDVDNSEQANYDELSNNENVQEEAESVAAIDQRMPNYVNNQDFENETRNNNDPLLGESEKILEIVQKDFYLIQLVEKGFKESKNIDFCSSFGIFLDYGFQKKFIKIITDKVNIEVEEVDFFYDNVIPFVLTSVISKMRSVNFDDAKHYLYHGGEKVAESLEFHCRNWRENALKFMSNITEDEREELLDKFERRGMRFEK